MTSALAGRRWVAGSLCVLVYLGCAATRAWPEPVAYERPSKAFLATIEDDRPAPLPRYITAAERRKIATVRRAPEMLLQAAPAGDIHCMAEFEPCAGILVSWGVFNSVLTELVVAVAQPGLPSKAFVVVESSSMESSARSTLIAAGADISRVEFIRYTTDAVWMRDYGPRYILQEGTRAIINHTYNTPRFYDNAFPPFLGQVWHEPVYNIPLIHGGGNFMLTSTDEGFATELIVNDNPGFTQTEVEDFLLEYQNLDMTIFPGFPFSVDGTQHLDMWMIILDDDKVIIGDYSGMGSSYEPYVITEAAVDLMEARGFTVYRTPGWNSGAGGHDGTHYTYTNAVICNDRVMIPEFGGAYTAQDAAALATYQSALPGHTIIQVDCSEIIHYAGAIHCIVMHVPLYEEAEPVAKVLSPDGKEAWVVGDDVDVEWAAGDDDDDVTSIDILLSTDGGLTFPHVLATGLTHDAVQTVTVPDVPTSSALVKVVAHDGDGYTGEDISDATFVITDTPPSAVYSFPMNTNPGWTTQGLWSFGHPTGGGGDYGNPDPTGGHTGSNVMGYNLSGDYTANMTQRHVTTQPLDLTGIYGAELRFWRWLGVERPLYDHAYVSVSTDGTNWDVLWENSATITDGSWQLQTFDIAALASNQPSVQVRWTMGTTDYGWQYCGWNIDDVEIYGVPQTFDPADIDEDGAVTLDDHAILAACINGPMVTEPPAGCTADEFARADIDEDGDVDAVDFASLVEAFE